MDNQIEEHIRNCHKCNIYKRDTINRKNELKPIIAEKPLQIIGIDLVGLVVVDYFSKWIWTADLTSTTSKAVIDKLNEMLVWSWPGTPSLIISDQGPQLCSQQHTDTKATAK